MFSELVEQRLNEAQYRRSQVISILHSASDAARPAASANRSLSTLDNSNNTSTAVDPSNDRSYMNLYRASMLRAAPPLSDVAALRVDDLLTSFLRFRRSLHHLCYHGASATSSAANQISEVGVLQQRIEKVQFECFVMLEELRQNAASAPIETAGPVDFVETAEVSALRAAIREERQRLHEALERLQHANYAPPPHVLAYMTAANTIRTEDRTNRPVQLSL